MDLHQLSQAAEAVSAHYARANDIERDPTWFLLKLHEEVGELTQAFLMRAGQARDKGHSPDELDARLGAELADVLCHLILMARHHRVDLDEAVRAKWLAHRPPPDRRTS